MSEEQDSQIITRLPSDDDIEPVGERVDRRGDVFYFWTFVVQFHCLTLDAWLLAFSWEQGVRGVLA